MKGQLSERCLPSTRHLQHSVAASVFLAIYWVDFRLAIAATLDGSIESGVHYIFVSNAGHDQWGGRMAEPDPTDYPGEQVRLSGGKRLGGDQAVTNLEVLDRLSTQARNEGRQIELKSHGITDVGEVAQSGRRSELFYRYQLPWSERYPDLVNILDENPAAPHGKKVIRNISWGGRWKNVEKKVEPGIEVVENLVDVDPGFTAPDHLDFFLQDDCPAWEIGFQPIPFSKIGLISHE
jgi:hypothetical protein